MQDKNPADALDAFDPSFTAVLYTLGNGPSSDLRGFNCDSCIQVLCRTNPVNDSLKVRGRLLAFPSACSMHIPVLVSILAKLRFLTLELTCLLWHLPIK